MGKVKDYPPYLDYPKERKPMTNADRIRAMTDEELSKKLMCPHPNDPCPPYFQFGRNANVCEHCIFDWLKQEVTDNAV